MGVNVKNNIKTLLEVAAKCGGFTRELAEELGVKYRRLKQLEELNYISKPYVFTIREGEQIKNKYLYTVNKQGEKFLKEEAICVAIAPMNGYEHTKCAEQTYLDLRQEYQAQVILNELEQRYFYFKDEIEDMENKKIDYSIVDFCVIKEDNDIDFVEVTTKNYREKDFVKKDNYCSYFGKSPNYR